MSFEVSIFLTICVCIMILLIDCYLEKNNIFDSNNSILMNVKRLFEAKYYFSIILFIFAFMIIYLLNNHKFISYNNYSYFAQALLNGRLDIPDMPQYLESIEFNGKTYMHFAPGPTLLVLPFIAIWGIDFNVNIISIILGAANIVLFFNILKKLDINSTKTRLWLSALFGFGTVHLFCSVIGHSWFFGHMSTTFFILLALLFVFDKNSEKELISCFFSGLFFGISVTCRMPMLLSGIFFIASICKYKNQKYKALLYFALGAFFPGSLYMLYNFVRFGTIMDQGYFLTFIKDRSGQTGGPLQLKFIPYNLYSIFILAPEWIGEFPYIKPSQAGVSLTFTTPAIYYAFKAKGHKFVIIMLWITVALTSIPFLMNYGNGMAQFSMRYAMDFLPFLIILSSLAMRNLDTYKKIVIMLCIWINIWGVLYWNYFYIK